MKYFAIIFFVLIPFFGTAQTSLNRPDSVENQRIFRYGFSNFSKPTEGRNQTWDFRDVLLDERARLIRLLAETVNDTVFITHTDGRTIYYSFLSENQHVLLQYDKTHVRIAYDTAQILMQYPLNFGQSFSNRFSGNGYYTLDRTQPIRGRRESNLTGTGKLILPNGRLLSDVFLVRSQIRHARVSEGLEERFEEVYAFYNSESVMPIIEISYIGRRDSQTVQAHYYKHENAHQGVEYSYDDWEEPEEPSFVSSIAPNPTYDHVVVTLILEQQTTAFWELRTMQGTLITSSQWNFPAEGVYSQDLYLSNYNLQSGIYLLIIRMNNHTETHKIQKN
jgi:hypothetical protein